MINADLENLTSANSHQLKRYISYLVICILLLKFAYYAFSFASPFPEYNRLKYEYFGQYFLQTYSNNDSGWYEKICEYGYDDNVYKSIPQSPYAFFPLYPFIGHCLVLTTGISCRLSLFLISSIASIFAAIYLFLFISKYVKDLRKAIFGVLVYFTWPHHYYFSMIYTESLFLLLLILSFYAIQKRRFALLTIASSLLVLTRINGIFMLVPLVLFELEVKRVEGVKANFTNLTRCLSIFIPMISTFLIYVVYLWLHKGDGLFFVSAAEKGWSGSKSNPLLVILNGLLNQPFNSHYFYNTIYAFFVLILGVALFYNSNYWALSLLLVTILLPLIEGSATSQPRFISIVFPLFVEVAFRLYERIGGRALYLIIILVFAQFITLYFWNISSQLSC